ncbi:MAG TPA: glycoside hydrolase family 76 protein, partial [Solirubrobacteraceae bacterium]|nr:glycoside hydrolase family 76 protein [Solirubrobacteraceae bacterium]
MRSTLPAGVRRRLLCGSLALGLLTAVCLFPQTSRARAYVRRLPVHVHVRPAPLRGDALRALVSYEAMQRAFYVPGAGLYRGEHTYSYLWPFSQALAATVSLAYIPHEARRLRGDLSARLAGLHDYLGPAATSSASERTGEGSGEREAGAEAKPPAPPLESFASVVAPPLGGGGTSYYDDNEWVGIELLRLYELDHDPAALERAKQVMAFVMAGWKTVNSKGAPVPCAGGVPFASSGGGNETRNTVTDGPAAELGARLFRVTHEIQYLQFAQMAYGWVRSCLLEPGGLYADHIEEDGEVEPMIWSYNQGSMIGAGALLYQATGDAAYLYEARRTAAVALSYFPLEKLAAENPFFVAVFLRGLLYLDWITHDPPGPRLAQSYVDYAWENIRTSEGLFLTGSPPTSEVLGQAAVV